MFGLNWIFIIILANLNYGKIDFIIQHPGLSSTSYFLSFANFIDRHCRYEILAMTRYSLCAKYHFECWYLKKYKVFFSYSSALISEGWPSPFAEVGGWSGSVLDADKETKVLRQAGTKNTELAQYLLKIHASFKIF